MHLPAKPLSVSQLDSYEAVNNTMTKTTATGSEEMYAKRVVVPTSRQGSALFSDPDDAKTQNDIANEVEKSFHYETAYLAKLKGALAERKSAYSISITMKQLKHQAEEESLSPGATDTSDSSSDSECDASLEPAQLLEDQRSSSKLKEVRFSTVSIRTYALTVGDAPGKQAYPLSLDWGHTATETLDFRLFEDLFSAGAANTRRSYARGFRKPRRLATHSRLRRLAAVTGKSPQYLYELELARMKQQGNAFLEVEDSDQDDDEAEACSRRNPYQLVDIDEYQRVDI